MSSHPSGDGAAAAEVHVEVTHAGRKMRLSFCTAAATVGDVKNELFRRSGVPREKQRLLFGAPVLKEHRREGRDDVRLLDLIAKPTSAAASVTIPLMLIGSAAVVPHINEEAVAQLHRLVSTTVEHDGSWFRCSYNRGYARQTAFVCRTCVKSGRSNPEHAICYACAEVCHRSHDVEEWGVRYHMRCDCCTAVCWKDVENKNKSHRESEEVATEGEKEPQWCCFLIDSGTGLPPSTSVVPMNSKNRYPRSSFTWCYCDCEEDHPTDDPDCGGVVCMLCTTCYWSSHMTRIHSDMLSRVPCYGDVVEGSIVAFHCRTCATLVCSPCYLCCHKDHDVDPNPILPSRDQGTDNGAPEDMEFSCGCRGCCSIAEEVPLREVDNPARCISAPPNIAIEIMNNDSFMGFICAHCMQEYPWLVENDPRLCYNGQLPEKVPAARHKRVVACGLAPDADCPADVYPFHGMLFPVNGFTEEMTCKCTPCQQAYERFAPRATAVSVNDMMIPLHDACDHCNTTIKDEQAFMCQTCELQLNRTFCICHRCNSLRLACEHPGLSGETRSEVNDSSDQTNAGETTEAKTTLAADDVPPWDHPISHVFMEDTYENLYTLCGMQLMTNLDGASRQYVMENLEATSASLEGVVQRTLGHTPLVFDPSEVAQHHQRLLQEGQRSKDVRNGEGSALGLPAKQPRCDENGGGDAHQEEGSERRRSKKE